MIQLLALFLLITFSGYAESNPEIILLYGTSCAGKSTIANQLQQKLNFETVDMELNCWEILDWDVYANEFGDDLASGILLDDLMQCLMNGKRIIVDAQPCVEFECTLKNYTFKKVLVYAPLETLISRDNARNNLLKRSEKRQQYARAYIYETFFQLYGIEATNIRVAEIDPSDVQSDFIEYPLNEATYDFFQNIVERNIKVSIYTKQKYDLVVNTELLDIHLAVSQIYSILFGSTILESLD